MTGDFGIMIVDKFSHLQNFHDHLGFLPSTQMRTTMAIKSDCAIYRFRALTQLFLSQEFQTWITQLILTVSFMTGFSLRLLPLEYIDGNPVPTIIFKGHPSVFHAFVVCIIFAFTASFCALLMETKGKFGKFCRYYSMVSMASALWVVFYALFLDGFKRVSSAKQG